MALTIGSMLSRSSIGEQRRSPGQHQSSAVDSPPNVGPAIVQMSPPREPTPAAGRASSPVPGPYIDKQAADGVTLRGAANDRSAASAPQSASISTPSAPAGSYVDKRADAEATLRSAASGFIASQLGIVGGLTLFENMLMADHASGSYVDKRADVEVMLRAATNAGFIASQLGIAIAEYEAAMGLSSLSSLSKGFVRIGGSKSKARYYTPDSPLSDDQEIYDASSVTTSDDDLDTRDVHASTDDLNIYGPDSPLSDGSPISVDQLSDDAISGVSNAILTPQTSKPEPRRIDKNKLFIRSHADLSNTSTTINPSLVRVDVRSVKRELARSFFPDGVIPASFDGEQRGSFFKSEQSMPSDDDAYVPLSFTDMRKVDGSWRRTVYFRPFIENLSEDFSPELNVERYYGRVDPVVGYKGTTRKISLTFRVAAFSAEDINVIYKKVAWLTSMVYPSYTKDMLYKSGPVVKLRVGDIISTHAADGVNGVPGVLDSLSYDYSDVPWELADGMKAPMSVRVSTSMIVLHDALIGIGVSGKFGGMSPDGSGDVDRRKHRGLGKDPVFNDWNLWDR